MKISPTTPYTLTPPLLISDLPIEPSSASPFARQNIRFKSEEEAAMAGFRMIAKKKLSENSEFGFQIIKRDGQWALGSLKSGSSSRVNPISFSFNPRLPFAHNHPSFHPAWSGLSPPDFMGLLNTRPDAKGWRNTYLMSREGFVFKISVSKNFILPDSAAKVENCVSTGQITAQYIGNARDSKVLPNNHIFLLEIDSPDFYTNVQVPIQRRRWTGPKVYIGRLESGVRHRCALEKAIHPCIANFKVYLTHVVWWRDGMSTASHSQSGQLLSIHGTVNELPWIGVEADTIVAWMESRRKEWAQVGRIGFSSSQVLVFLSGSEFPNGQWDWFSRSNASDLASSWRVAETSALMASLESLGVAAAPRLAYHDDQTRLDAAPLVEDFIGPVRGQNLRLAPHPGLLKPRADQINRWKIYAGLLVQPRGQNLTLSDVQRTVSEALRKDAGSNAVRATRERVYVNSHINHAKATLNKCLFSIDGECKSLISLTSKSAK